MRAGRADIRHSGALAPTKYGLASPLHPAHPRVIQHGWGTEGYSIFLHNCRLSEAITMVENVCWLRHQGRTPPHPHPTPSTSSLCRETGGHPSLRSDPPGRRCEWVLYILYPQTLTYWGGGGGSEGRGDGDGYTIGAPLTGSKIYIFYLPGWKNLPAKQLF